MTQQEEKENEDSETRDEENGLVGTKANEHYMKGLQCIKDMDHVGGFQHFSKAVFLLPDEPILYVARAESCVHLCDLSSAVGNYKKAISLEREPDPSHKQRLTALLDCLGLLAFSSSRFEKAMMYFDTALQYTPNSKPVRLHHSLTLFMLCKMEESLRSAEACEGTEQCQPFVWVAKTVYYLKLQNFSEAKTNLEKCLLIAPELPLVSSLEMTFEAIFNRFKNEAVTAMEEERWNDAEKKLDVCISAFPHDPSLYETRSACHAAKQEYTAAVQDLFENINKSGMATARSASQLAETLTRIALELAAKGSFHQSLDYCDEALKWDPKKKDSLLQRAECLKMIGDHEASFCDLRTVLDHHPSDWETVWRLSQLHASWGSKLYSEGKYGRAEKEFEKALACCNEEPMHHINRAKCLLMLQQPSAAIREYIECLKLSAGDPVVAGMVRKLCPPDVYQAVMVHMASQRKDMRLLGSSGIMIMPSPPTQVVGQRQKQTVHKKLKPIKPVSAKPHAPLLKEPIEPLRMTKGEGGVCLAEQPKKILSSDEYNTQVSPFIGHETYSEFRKGDNEEIHSLRVGQSVLHSPYGITAIRGLAEQAKPRAAGESAKVTTTHWRGASGFR
eukprot:TRINITY_DN30215_c0_g1_i1.p1 TRINITY_DN30215_c0_g1~~TRINITY_DN30215_c0_g1_i1.p1  ORF type:complete len:616 (+),score=132.48 TRINITY_DN30215_c0_g1_i1:29-1876(+)